MLTAYLAGPDVFLPNAEAHARQKVAICAGHGILGRPPLNEGERDWRAIYDKDIAMMEASDIVIANLTPFRGASADAGTLVEIGWFLGRGRPVFGYSNSATTFAERSRRHVSSCPDPIAGLDVEGMGLPDNLMIEGAVTGGIMVPAGGRDLAFDSLEMFAACVARAAAHG